MEACRDIRLRHLRVLEAEDICPSQLAAYDVGTVVGPITGVGGTRSHSTIIASLGIPAVVGVGAVIEEIGDGVMVALNGTTGEIHVEPTKEQQADIEEQIRLYANRQLQMERFKMPPAVTQEGQRLHIAANIAGPNEVAKILDVGVDGIGLYRTEFLFMDRPVFPSEDEQFEAYRMSSTRYRENQS